MRKNIPLNFEWFYRADFDAAYLGVNHPLAGFEAVSLPHTNKELPYNNFNERDYQFVCSYVRDLGVVDMADDDRLILHFGAVMTACEVYLNGSLVGGHEGGFTPFDIDLTDGFVKAGPNRLFVKVDAREIKDVPPFGNVVDYLCYGGIYREVSLFVRPATHITRLLVKTLEAPSLALTEMMLEATVLTSGKLPENTTAEVLLYKDGVVTMRYENAVETFENTLTLRLLVPDVERWDLDHPMLYELEVTLRTATGEIDRDRTRFGFRTAEFTTEGFVLNSKRIKLIGLNRHQSFPYVGFAMPKRIQQKDADILKYDLGCTIVRTSHYMQSDHFIDRCDEVGLLVFEEIPGWQYIGDDHFKELTLANEKAMILAHFNHPSIILWGVRINESPDDHDFYVKTNELAHNLDEGRPTGGVRNFKKSDFLEDVYTYNDFSHTGQNAGLIPPRRVTKRMVPYLVTEHNGHIFPTKKFDTEAKRIEQALRHMKVIDASFGHEDSAGAIGWCMSDYNTHVEFGAGDRICYHGVLDMFRIPKYAAGAYAAQQTARPVMTVASNMTMGDHSLAMIPPTVIFTNCDYVKVYRNEVCVGTWYSAWGEYKHVPFAPVIVDDYFGDLIKDNEPYRPRIAAMIKKVLIAYNRHGFKMPLVDRLRMARLMLFHKLTYHTAMNLYGKYVGDWGKEGAKYVYEGYQKDQVVIRAEKGASHGSVLTAVADDVVLCHGDTYDVTRIVVRMTDEHNNDLTYASDAFTVKTSAGLAVIGPEKQALIGGSIGVYVRTTGITGKQTVTICPAGRPEIRIPIRVE